MAHAHTFTFLLFMANDDGFSFRVVRGSFGKFNDEKFSRKSISVGTQITEF